MNRVINKNEMSKSLSTFLIMTMMITFIAILSGFFSIFIFGTLLNILVIYLIRNRNHEFHKTTRVIFVVSIIYVIVAYYGSMLEFGIPYYQNDDIVAENRMISILSQWRINPFYSIPNLANNGVYVSSHIWTLGLLYKLSFFIGGYNTYIPRLLNIYLIFISAILLLDILVYFFKINKQNRKTFLYTITLSPNILFVGSFVYRDVIIIFVIILVLNILVKLLFFKKRISANIVNILTIIILLFYLYYLREIMLVMLLISSLPLFYYRFKQSFFVYLIFIVLVSVPILYSMNLFESVLTGIRYDILEWQNVYNPNEAGELSGFFLSQKLDLIGIFIRLIGGIVLGFYNLKLALISNPVFGLLHLLNATTYLYIIFNFIRFKKLSKKILIILTPLIVFYISYALITYNFRHFIYFLYFYYAFITISTHRLSFRRYEL